MPISEFRCTICRKHHEFWQEITELPKTRCPVCGGTLQKLRCRSSRSLKGGGWYADGSARTVGSIDGNTAKPAMAHGKEAGLGMKLKQNSVDCRQPLP